MGKLFVIMGKSASGKDTLYRLIMERHPELRPVVPYTTPVSYTHLTLPTKA